MGPGGSSCPDVYRQFGGAAARPGARSFARSGPCAGSVPRACPVTFADSHAGSRGFPCANAYAVACGLAHTCSCTGNVPNGCRGRRRRRWRTGSGCRRGSRRR